MAISTYGVTLKYGATNADTAIDQGFPILAR